MSQFFQHFHAHQGFVSVPEWGTLVPFRIKLQEILAGFLSIFQAALLYLQDCITVLITALHLQSNTTSKMEARNFKSFLKLGVVRTIFHGLENHKELCPLWFDEESYQVIKIMGRKSFIKCICWKVSPWLLDYWPVCNHRCGFEAPVRIRNMKEPWALAPCF